ncbi:MAG: DNA-processing protein DprA [Aggregatilineales bacterium]
MNESKYWLGFSLVPEIGPRRLARLLSVFGDAASAWNATETQLRRAGIENRPLENLLYARKSLDLDLEMEKVKRTGAWLITLADDAYPPLLRQIAEAPTVLYVRGTLETSDAQALSVVGTRKATAYGRDAAHELARQLARSGVTIISGLAHGIDSAAHAGALAGGGRTLAVLGCGIDRIYPSHNRALAENIVQRGALVSEFPIGTPPDGRNFPRRNRIISGMALGVLVVEAPENSGALITAAVAADQGREVFAVPGNIFNPSSRGSNRLIQDGAKLVMEVDDILLELNLALRNVQLQAAAEQVAPANGTEARLLEHLSADPLHVDELARLVDLPIAVVTSTLAILELKGLVRTAGPMQYALTRS